MGRFACKEGVSRFGRGLVIDLMWSRRTDSGTEICFFRYIICIARLPMRRHSRRQRSWLLPYVSSRNTSTLADSLSQSAGGGITSSNSTSFVTRYRSTRCRIRISTCKSLSRGRRW